MSILGGLINTKKLKSLAVTLVLVFLALTMVTLIISTGLNMYFRVQTQQEVIDNQQQLITHEAADAVRGFIRDKFKELEDGIRIGNLGAVSKDEQELILERLIGLDPALRQLALLNDQGQLVLKTSRLSSFATPQLTEAEGDILFLEECGEERYISDVYINNVTCEPMVIISVPVKDIFPGTFQGGRSSATSGHG